MKLGKQFNCEHCNHPLDHAANDWTVKEDDAGAFVGHKDELGCNAAKMRFIEEQKANGSMPHYNPDIPAPQHGGYNVPDYDPAPGKKSKGYVVPPPPPWTG